MRSYVLEVEWNCEFCDTRQEFRYLGQNSQFCSNICKQRARKVERSLKELLEACEARIDRGQEIDTLLARPKFRDLLEEVRGCTEQRYNALREEFALDTISTKWARKCLGRSDIF